MNNIIADTNVWYAIGNGNTDMLKYLKSKGKLCAVPLNLLEIASKINENNFDIRQKAAQAIVDHADRFLKTNESYLLRYWGVKDFEDIDWKQGAIAIIKASSPEELEEGYDDFIDGVSRKQNTQLLQHWREYQYEDFKQGVIDGIKNIHPNYIRQTRNGKKITKITDENLLAEFDSQNMKNGSLNMTYYRVSIILKSDNIKFKLPNKPSHKSLASANQKLNPYINAYSQYLKYLVTAGALPDKNDLGDHEMFMYLQNKKWLLATSDKRWIRIAETVCPDNLLNLSSL